MKQGKTLEQLGTESQRQRSARADFIADTRQLNFSTENNKFRITFENGGKTMDFGINPLAHQQIASRLGIPLKYYQRMQAELLPCLMRMLIIGWNKPRKKNDSRYGRQCSCVFV